ncbi:MAG: UDP-N-acetylmuramoylalanyl-D-glutamyl-2,6-diaminopimelate--D-alanyl-D-alanine ligase [Geminicoccaceae bacterium]
MSRALWSADEIAAATGGKASGGHGGGDWSVAGIAIDSRTVLPGELFIALRGPNHDGHDFVPAALERGAACLVDDLSARLPDTAPLIKVEDTMTALTALGRAARARSTARITAITGSVGKTGTKEALALALSSQASTHASVASFNNHWGVPLSLARAPRDSVYEIYELGMNAPGEIAELTRLVQPEVALITTIAPAHLGRFPSVDAIAEAKAEIFQGLIPGGTVVLDRDNPYFAALRERAQAFECGRVIGFGKADDADARLLACRLQADGSDVRMALDGTELRYRVGAPGRHWVKNSLAVIAIAAALGADPERAGEALAKLEPPKGRGKRHRIVRNGGEIEVIDESYNANPVSMRAAISLLENIQGRRIVALGDMLELGEETARFHAELVEPLAESQVDRVFTVGSAMRHLHAALPKDRRGIHVEQAEKLVPILASELMAGDTILVKGSLGSAMGQVVEALLADGERGGEHASVSACNGDRV